VRIIPTMAPSGITEIMRTVLRSSNLIMPTRAPTVQIKSLDAQAIEFELSFRVRDFSAASAARHELYDLIYRHLRAARLMLAPPKEAAASALPQPHDTLAASRPTALRLIDAVPLFVSLTEDEKQGLASTMIPRTFRKGETVAEQGTKLSSLFIIRAGVLLVTRKEAGGEVELARLSPGDYFGEAGLFTGHGEPGSIRAMTFTVVYEVGQAALGKLLKDRPSVAEDISLTLSQRGKHAAVDDASEAEHGSTRSMSELMDRIRSAFELA